MRKWSLVFGLRSWVDQVKTKSQRPKTKSMLKNR